MTNEERTYVTARQGNGKRHIYSEFFETFTCGVYANKPGLLNVVEKRVTDGSDVTCSKCVCTVNTMREIDAEAKEAM